GLALARAARARPLGACPPWPGVVACLVIGFGWWIAAEVSTPGFGWYTAIDNHVLNVARARHFADEDVPLTALQFLAVAVGWTGPWIVAAGVALWSLARRRAWRDPDEVAWTALALWALSVLVVTALSPFRLSHYGLPASFALALLAARAWEVDGGRRLALVHAGLFAVIGFGMALAWTGPGPPPPLGGQQRRGRRRRAEEHRRRAAPADSAVCRLPAALSRERDRVRGGGAGDRARDPRRGVGRAPADPGRHDRHRDDDRVAALGRSRARARRQAPRRARTGAESGAARGAGRRGGARGPHRELRRVRVVRRAPAGDRRRPAERPRLRRRGPGGARSVLGWGAA